MNSNTTLVKVKFNKMKKNEKIKSNSNTTLVKVKSTASFATLWNLFYSNTTLVKVKLKLLATLKRLLKNSNTTLVKVKLMSGVCVLPFKIFKYNSC